jgi:heterodisulfide reductase subunit A
VEASGAAASAAAQISTQRFTRTTLPEFPPERDVSAEEARIGVFVCHCGSNIAGYLDVPEVSEYAAELPGVVHAESNVYTCSQDSIRHITETVEEHQLNRVIVASCTPLTHAPLFQDSIRAAGLNPYLFEMANIRNQCSWVHSSDREAATGKAKDLVRMAVARAALLEMQTTFQVPVENTALVVGGGVAGMTAALSLADNGFPVVLVEKEAELGGNLRFVHTVARQLYGVEAKDPQRTLSSLVKRVNENEGIRVQLNSRVVASSGFMGNFTSTILRADGEKDEVRHGATILATGAQEYRGPEYGYGQHDQVVTQQGLEALIANDPAVVGRLKSVVMIQCVGPGETFCSRICCSVALKNALALKAVNPEVEIVILYRDIRTYGFKERLYTAARQQGVLFIRYDPEHRPEIEFHPPVEAGAIGGETEQIEIRAWDAALSRQFVLNPDMLILSMPVVPNDDAHELAALFKAQVDADGFFQEAHVKLRPVDFATEGVFMAGLAHYPKLLDESMIQAQAAAARAARVLSRESLTAGGRVAVVDPAKCTGCLTCVRICPFNVPKIQADVAGAGNIMGAASIEAAVCQGCGLCAAECPARAIQLMHYTDAQLMAKVRALVAPEMGFIPLDEVSVEVGKP